MIPFTAKFNQSLPLSPPPPTLLAVTANLIYILDILMLESFCILKSLSTFPVTFKLHQIQ